MGLYHLLIPSLVAARPLHCKDSAHCKTRVKVEQTCVSEYGKVDSAVLINQGAV